ncbi:phosphoribosyltransferase [Trinickia mobilis]|uniref:phosphoribosyltransferase n=1 Tax=Trinickia mobilis TaxID=2816356 RepID=UPI001A903A3E|nr:phosphoribosyltransferase family protein [Trinickia mobilis]
MYALFRDRSEAGRILAAQLRNEGVSQDAVVLALPRGGVPVGFEVATALDAELDVLPVRKLGVPGERELAMGAIAAGGALYVDHGTMHIARVTQAQFEAVHAEEQIELARRATLYRGENAPAIVEGRVAIVVDDGMATGSSMQAAVRALRKQQPARVIIGLPVAPLGAQADFSGIVDAFVCVANPPNFYSVGQYYEDFGETSDDEVRELLARARARKS